MSDKMNETKKRAAENPTENKKQAEAKIVVPVVRTVVVPFAYSAVVRVVVPTAAAFDAVITGSSTSFYPYRFLVKKIFEPLKRLTQCRSFLFSKISCTASTHLCFGRCAVTGCLRCALHCLPAYAQMRELKGAKPGGNQDSCTCRQDCCTPRLQCSRALGCANCRHDRRGTYPTLPLEGR